MNGNNKFNLNFEVYIFSTTLYYYTEYWILYFKVIIECNFNIKCNLNGNLTNYESRSFENWFNWFWKYILVYLKVFSNRNVLKEFKECFKLNFKEVYIRYAHFCRWEIISVISLYTHHRYSFSSLISGGDRLIALLWDDWFF